MMLVNHRISERIALLPLNAFLSSPARWPEESAATRFSRNLPSGHSQPEPIES